MKMSYHSCGSCHRSKIWGAVAAYFSAPFQPKQHYQELVELRGKRSKPIAIGLPAIFAPPGRCRSPVPPNC